MKKMTINRDRGPKVNICAGKTGQVIRWRKPWNFVPTPREFLLNAWLHDFAIFVTYSLFNELRGLYLSIWSRCFLWASCFCISNVRSRIYTFKLHIYSFMRYNLRLYCMCGSQAKRFSKAEATDYSSNGTCWMADSQVNYFWCSANRTSHALTQNFWKIDLHNILF